MPFTAENCIAVIHMARDQPRSLRCREQVLVAALFCVATVLFNSISKENLWVFDSTSPEISTPEYQTHPTLHQPSRTESTPRKPVCFASPTSTKPYNTLDDNVNYFVYTPSGGFNNQRAELGYAMLLAKKLNRSLVVPMAALHTSLWHNYYDLPSRDLYPMDCILEFPRLEEYGVSMIPLSIPLLHWVRDQRPSPMNWRVESVDRKLNEYHDWSTFHTELLNKFKGDKARIIMTKGGFFGQHPNELEIDQVFLYFRYARELRILAMEIGRAIGHPFNAIHFRRGDFLKQKNRIHSAEAMVQRAQQAGIVTSSLVYVATEPTRNKEAFALLDENFNTTYSWTLPGTYRMQFSVGLGTSRAVEDFFGIIEQLICAQAVVFLPSPLSTFSKWITFIREHSHELFPEMLH